ncbi:MAG: hypothetical protein HQL84_04355 [Magnetococcales bacterium]|nr:hypothetical protein [Magnetococcales bacterium]MBF0149260.1 hypothetical protein [Magnetococcales bacterium]MBF0172793.1 hypothetical protein [Magnetococcales bacterium]MBF0348003.1 hypothetical protein [Magnetococcales bacterium]MBF0632168.1 hypothetical protein [Magnetococcales bacterium]
MEIFNLIPLGFLGWVVFNAVKRGHVHGYMEHYFKINKRKTGIKFRNFFGIPNAKLK